MRAELLARWMRAGVKSFRATALWAWVAAALICAFILWQLLFFPTGCECRRLISEAERVEITTLISPGSKNEIRIATLTDPADIQTLAKSIGIRGFWVPFDYLIARCYRIVAFKGNQRSELLVRGGNRILRGRWSVSIAPSAIKTIVHLVEKSGGQVPSLLDMVTNKDEVREWMQDESRRGSVASPGSSPGRVER